jgi:hypothetical protein
VAEIYPLVDEELMSGMRINLNAVWKADLALAIASYNY